MMRNPFRREARLAAKVWGALIARFRSRPAPEVNLHDPAASRPHDLDDPFFDPKVQKRVADIIAAAARGKT